MARAAAYLRKSRSDDPTREVSRDVQERAVRALAAKDGHADVLLYVDWDRSADESKAARRTEFNRLVRAIEAGEIAVLYAYASDRLYRSIEAYIRLAAAAAAHGVKIVTERDGVIGGDGSPMGQAMAEIGAVIGKLELSTAKARARSAYNARVARGDRIGRPPYGWKTAKDGTGAVVLVPDPERPLQPVFDAYLKAGKKVRTAVRILNDDMKVPAPKASEWDRPTLLRIIARERPELLPPPTATGQRAASPDRLAKLSKVLKCPCGRLLTPNRHVEKRRRDGQETTSILYYCSRGMATRAEHPRVYVSESKVLPWVEEEIARYNEPQSAPVEPARDIEAERAALMERRRIAVEMRADGIIDRDEVRRRVAEVDRALAALETPTPPSFGLFKAETDAEFNERVRSILDHVVLDDMLMPVRAEWHNAAWRYDGEGLPPSMRVLLEELKRESVADYLAEKNATD